MVCVGGVTAVAGMQILTDIFHFSIGGGGGERGCHDGTHKKINPTWVEKREPRFLGCKV